MNKDLIFFGEQGLTATSANFVANMAKEMYRAAEADLDNMVFYDTKVKLLGTNEENILREGFQGVTDVPDTMKYIAELKSLIAWLREAIKAKERLIQECQNGDYEYYALTVPESPEKEDYLTEDDVIASFNVKQRNRYFYLEAFCATIGKYIHENGVYAEQRENLQKILHEPHIVSGNGRDTLIYTKTPSLPVTEVENVYMSLQQTYREYQAELNSIKHQIKDTVVKDTATKDIEYREKFNTYREDMKAVEAELARKRKEAVEAASNLKIIIPDTHKAIFERVQKMGK